MNRPHDPGREDETRDSVDRGLAEAFSQPDSGTNPSRILRALQERSRTVLGVQLEDELSADPAVPLSGPANHLEDPSGRYQLIGEIGRGGMGVVYQGRDQDLGRDVAMKVLKDEYSERPEVLARFVEEAQIGGQLQHPGIVPVYELGLQAGERPYFAMKLVKGENLAAQLARRDDSTSDRHRLLGIFEQVCHTVAYAHARRVVHRDLKPANVMIGAFGEVQVVDWGIAKVLPKDRVVDEAKPVDHTSVRSVIETVRSASGSGSDSVAGSMLGTPAYMPPEQALGDVERIDQRSDVFSLGAILCELLTGDPPYRAEDGDLVVQAANASLEGARERLRQSGADATLLSLCLECLSPARQARPESAAKVAERVHAYVTSVEARAQEAEMLAAEARYRHRMTLMSGAVGLIVLLLGTGVWFWKEQEAQSRRSSATQQVVAAMSATSGALGQAETAGLDLDRWNVADERARQLVVLASSDDVVEEVRHNAEQLITTVEKQSGLARTEAARRARDHTMLKRLENLRVPTDDDVRAATWWVRESERLDVEYADAFSEYMGGASILTQPAEVSLEALRRGDIEVELATSMDHWALIRDGLQARAETASPADPSIEDQSVNGPDSRTLDAGTSRLREVAMLLDAGDPWRIQLRSLLPNAAEEGDRLRALAERADFGALSGSGGRVLSVALSRAGETDASIASLRRVQEERPTDFDACFRLGILLEQTTEPQWEEAIAVYRIAHALRPNHHEVLHRMGLALKKLGRYEEAERVLGILISKSPDDPHWLRHLGSTYRLKGEHDRAFATYQRALGIAPDDSMTYKLIGVLYAAQGRVEDAIEQFRTALKLDPLNPSFHNNLANQLWALGRTDEAIASRKRAIEVCPHWDMLEENLAGSLAAVGRWDEALEHVHRALELNPRNSHAHCILGNGLSTKGRFKEALTAFDKSIALNCNCSVARAGAGAALIALNRHEEAVPYLEQALDLNPENLEALESTGAILGMEGRWPEAVDVFREVLSLDPGRASAHNGLGNVFSSQGQLAEAMASYRTAINLDPNLPRPRLNLGLLLTRIGRLQEANECFTQVLEADPTNAEAIIGQGSVLLIRGIAHEAEKCFRRAIDAAPDLAWGHERLGSVFLMQGRLTEAIRSFRKAIELDSRVAYYHINLAASLEQQGDLDAAIESYRRATELGPTLVEAHFPLGLALSRAGRQDESLECFQRTVALQPEHAPAQYNVGRGLRRQGDYRGAIHAFQRAEEIFALREDSHAREWGDKAREAAAVLERMLEEFDDILAGTMRAESPLQWAEAILNAYDQARFREIVTLTEQTMIHSPELAESVVEWGTYNSVCAIGLLIADPSAEVSDEERVRLQALAREWLVREIDVWADMPTQAGHDADEGKRRLKHCQSDSDLTSLRGPALARFPESERDAWRALWRRIEALCED